MSAPSRTMYIDLPSSPSAKSCSPAATRRSFSIPATSAMTGSLSPPKNEVFDSQVSSSAMPSLYRAQDPRRTARHGELQRALRDQHRKIAAAHRLARRRTRPDQAPAVLPRALRGIQAVIGQLDHFAPRQVAERKRRHAHRAGDGDALPLAHLEGAAAEQRADALGERARSAAIGGDR